MPLRKLHPERPQPEQHGSAAGSRNLPPRAVQGEDVIRQSGVPFAVVRPTALTEEDAGAQLQFDQGDTIRVGPTAATRPTHLRQLY